ncbi:MAG: ABC transporter permease [Comamonadaceae bacterium CG1_02_60_18]|nr:MAG: ABC transporter permease [Comamonadaceae bacterium CG1_02_60_18]PIQ52169.1 MAG: ABC transporter permease [Comamonadaceae bacterium CG12_big_fil_rev_8_21_14_0_65_59_15]
MVLVPVVVSALAFAQVDASIMRHLRQYVLPDLLRNTLWLLLGVGVGVTLLGVSLAALVALCDFPGRRWLQWALLLPLAVPAYVSGFVMIDLLDYGGPLQTWLREGWGVSPLPDIRNGTGVVLVLSLSLYPYVYLIAKNAFASQGSAALEAAQALGVPPWLGFLRVALPMARPWIGAGLLLALMETLADFGTMAVFNFDTFTTAIYKAWYGMFSLPAAAQLSSILLLFVLVLVVLEQRSRRGMRFAAVGRSGSTRRRRLRPWPGVLALAYALAVLALAFGVPVTQLVRWSVASMALDLDTRYFSFVWHSVLLAALGTALVVATALLLAYAGRQRPGGPMTWLQRLATLGYAFPGAVLAVGWFIPVAGLDAWLAELAQSWLGIDTHGWLKGTLLVMLLGYLVRFLAVSFGPLNSGLQRMGRNVDEAAHSMGVHGLALLRQVHWPALRVSVQTAAVLTFVDIVKEMPITLMTRPFGWDTLAVRIFEMTSEGEWQRAALPAVAIVLVAMVPIGLLASRKEHADET